MLTLTPETDRLTDRLIAHMRQRIRNYRWFLKAELAKLAPDREWAAELQWCMDGCTVRLNQLLEIKGE